MFGFYTNVNLFHKLYQNKLTATGTMMNNRKNVPDKSKSIYDGPEWIQQGNKRKRGKKRDEYSSVFYYCDYSDPNDSNSSKTLLFLQSYMCKKNKTLLFLSTSSRSTEIPSHLPNG